MPVTHPTQRVGVLADAQNLYHTAQSLYSRNIDYSSLLEGALEGQELTRAIAYVIGELPEERELLRGARRHRLRDARQKDIKTFEDGSKKADWDVE